MFPVIFIVLALLAPPAGAAESYPSGQLSDDAIPAHYTLDLKIIPTEETFSGTVAIDVTLKQPASVIWMHGRELTVATASVTDAGGAVIPATWSEIPDSDGVAKLTLARPAQGPKVLITISYAAPFNKRLEGIYRADDAGTPYIFSQMEPISARVAFPGFDDPRFKTPYDTSLTVPAGDSAISNGAATTTEVLDGGLKRVRFTTTKPLPTYLVAVAVGPFDVVEGRAIPPSAVRPHAIPLRGIATRGKGPRLKYAIENTAPLFLALEDYFGIAYPFDKLDIIAAPDFSAGAMENAGAIVYREGLLLMDDVPSMSQKRRYVGVHAHEMAHQWVGDLVTPVWWNDIWLNESFATWMSDKVAAGFDPQGGYDRAPLRGAISAMAADSKSSSRRIAQPIESNDDIDNAFDSITYEKGGGVLSMFEHYYGVEAFRKGVQLHLQRRAFGSATAADFLKAIADANNDSKGPAAFATFLNQPGVPLVDVIVACGAKGNTISLKQSRYRPKAGQVARNQTWKIPLCVAYGTGAGREKVCKLVEEKASTIAVNSCPTWVMPNADGAGYYRFGFNRDSWRALAKAVDALTDTEMLAVLDSLEAGVSSGDLDLDEFLDNAKLLMARNGGNITWDAASALTPRLIWIKNTLATPRSKPVVEKYIAELYQPLFDKVGLDNTTAFARANPAEATLLRGPAVTMVAVEGRTQPTRGELGRRGAAYVGVGTDGKLHTDAVDADLADEALTVAVKDTGAPVVDAIFALLTTERDGTVRARLLGALTRSTDPDIAARVRDLALSKDLRANELPEIVFGSMSELDNVRAAWTWFKKNYEPIKAAMPYFGRSGLAGMGGRFCDQALRDDYRDFFRTRVRSLVGGARVFDATLESIDHCVALAGAQRSKVNAYFAKN